MAISYEKQMMKIGLIDPMLAQLYRIDRIRHDTSDTFTIEMACEDGFEFEPGQFNMLYIYGVGEIPISISGNPLTPHTLVHTTRAVGVVTRAMQHLKVGDMLGVRGPFGTSWPIEQAKGKDVVFITGGIGLAPLRPAIYSILANRDLYKRVVLLYGARTPSDILYRAQLKKWEEKYGLEVYTTVDRATGAWQGNVGVVTNLIAKAPFDPTNMLTMVCGPEVMMRFAVQTLERRGVTTDNIYVSLERNMKCAIGYCGHCQLGPVFVCKDGPVFRFDQVEPFFGKWEI